MTFSFPTTTNSSIFQSRITMNEPGTLSFNPYNHQDSSYGEWGATSLVENDRELSQENENSYSNWYNHSQEGMKSDHSGSASPFLWRNSPSPSRPLLSHRGFSPNSRAEAIVRGQWELMELVKNMPESSYELSLKDIVEHHRVETPSANQTAGVESSSAVDVNQSLHQRGGVKVKREDQSRKMDRNLSFENKGLFLNMVFPFSFKSKKKNKFVRNDSVKVSAKPQGLKDGGERDWWKKRFTGSSDSDSSRTSNNSGSTSGAGSSSGSSGGISNGGRDTGVRKTNGFLSACWPFFHSRSNKSAG